MSRLAWRPGALGSISGNRWVRGAALAGFVLLGDLIIALAVVDPRFHRLLLLGLGVAGLAFVFRFPFAGTCAVLFLVASILEPGRFKLPAGPIEWRLEEVIIGTLLLVAVVRPRRDWWGGIAGGALAAFFVVLGASGLLALQSGRVGFADAFAYARLFAPLLLFYVIVRLFPEAQQVRRLLLVAVVLAAFTGVVSLAVAAPGSPLTEVLNPNATASIRDKEGLGLVNRVRLSGVSLAYVLFWYVAAQAIAARRGRRLLWSLTALAGVSLGIVLSFNRNMWIGLIVGFLLMLALGRSVSRRHLTAALTVLAAGSIAIALAGPTLSSGSPLYPFVERGNTLLHPEEEARDPSLNDRRLENRFAVATIERYPVTGVGPGAPYGVDWLWVHNQYLHLLLLGGPAALIAFLVFIGAPPAAVLSRRLWDDELPALAVGILITMVSAIVMISFVNATWAAVVALLAGVLTVRASSGTAHSTAGSEGPSGGWPDHALGGEDAADIASAPLRGTWPLDEQLVREGSDESAAQR